MEKVQDSIDETLQKLIVKAQELRNMEDLIKEEVKVIETLYDRLVNLVYDIKRIARIQRNNAESYSSFKVIFNFNGSADIHSPFTNIFITEISNECLMSKPIFVCLDEKFTDKEVFYDKLMQELLAAFSNYVEKIQKYLPDLRKIEWIERDINTIMNSIELLKRKLSKKEEEEEQEE
jgi:uncharacterized protein (UPF0305 family)